MVHNQPTWLVFRRISISGFATLALLTAILILTAEGAFGQGEPLYGQPVYPPATGPQQPSATPMLPPLNGENVFWQPSPFNAAGQIPAPSERIVLPEEPPAKRRLLDCLDIGLVARGYYRNDQRVDWSGMEETFGAEAALTPRLKQMCGDWEVTVDSEFYLNEPYNRNMLLDTAERRSYASNFRTDTLEISRLSVALRRDDFTLLLGKMNTPFGRTYFPLYSNARIDAPFIRTESILWRETGVLARYKPGMFVADLALVNGCENLDTNSSKALVSRLGLEAEQWAVGCSVKFQDGIGSEDQKEYRNHLGVDMMVRDGSWNLSAECIYDQYGFTRPKFNPMDIAWDRSIYYRDESSGRNAPITGIGYYANLDYQWERWAATLNYGEFYPESIGVPQHDRVQRRGILKLACTFAEHLQVYSVVMLENGGYIAQEGRSRIGAVVLNGLQYTF